MNIIVIFHSREKFYGKPIYWYQFETARSPVASDSRIPEKFLRVPLTVYWEYGGTHEEALKDLTNSGFTRIIEGMEL
jgi:hypothetical protein